MNGTIYLNNGRYWWKVRLPGQMKISFISLKPLGSKFATKDPKIAELIASEIWLKNIKSIEPAKYDGKLITLIKLYNQNNIKYYLPPSKQAKNIEHALIPLARFCPAVLSDDFTPLMLKAFREWLLNNYDLTRQTINRRIEMIKRMFKWAASEMLVSIYSYTALTTVEGLRRGRTEAREGKEVPPVRPEAITAALMHVTAIVADMIQIQLLTGMRPGELCIMKPCDIDRASNIWIYIPQQHKTQYLGHPKSIAIGPRAQQILNKYLFNPDPTDYCFKPEISERQSRVRRLENRKTPLNHGNCPGSNNKGIRTFNEHFAVPAYRKAIARACVKAGVENWHPHQLRHNRGTEIRDLYTPDDAQAVLGHKTIKITEHYAQVNFNKAKKVMAEIG